MNKRKVSFMLITMFVTSSIFSGCLIISSLVVNGVNSYLLVNLFSRVNVTTSSLYSLFD